MQTSCAPAGEGIKESRDDKPKHLRPAGQGWSVAELGAEKVQSSSLAMTFVL
jgi:hypothetical protein